MTQSSRLIYTLDADLRFISVGAATLARWGRSHQEVVGRKITEVFPRVEQSPILGAFHEALQSFRPVRRRFDSVITPGQVEVEIYPVNGVLQVTVTPV